MSPRRATSIPPTLPGFEYVDLLGSGGFADVFLYEQQLPRRKVAVKVLLPDALGTDAVEGFTHEANLMAQLATHPSIVSIYQAGLAGDGRPYLVMEFCSRPNLQVRHRRERFSEAETLRIGIQIAGAVETAHRAGILHRDIKPANILVSDYGRPALTDFGIASAPTGNAEAESVGMSVPWSPPETFGVNPVSTVRSDVYSLGATLFTLLTGRSPFEVPGQSNSNVDLIRRIQQNRAPRVGRADVSESLERVLAMSLARDPTLRHASAMEFARALQRVQIEHGMQPTTVDVIDEQADAVPEEMDDGDGPTRIRGIVSIPAQGPTERSSTRWEPAQAASPMGGDAPEILSVDQTQRRGNSAALPSAGGSNQGGAWTANLAPAVPAVADTQRRPAPVGPGPAPSGGPASGSRRRGTVIAGGIVALLVVGGGIVAATSLTGGRTSTSAPKVTSQPKDPVGQAVPDVTAVAGKKSSSGVVFTWKNPEPRPGDHYQWRTVTSTGAVGNFAVTSAPTVTVPAASVGETCIQVQLVRSDGTASPDDVQGCAP